SSDDARYIAGSAHTLEAIATTSTFGGVFRSSEQMATIQGEAVSGNYFSTTGATALRGRLLGAADDDPSAVPAVVLGEQFWRTRLDARPEIVGALAYLCGQPVVVVGVAPQSFLGLQSVPMRPTQVWISDAATERFGLASVDRGNGTPRMSLFGRIAPDR